MARRLFTLLSTLSLLLCAATVMLWVRGYRTKAAVDFQRRDGRWEVSSHAGRFQLDNSPQQRFEADQRERDLRELRQEDDRLYWQAQGLRAYRNARHSGGAMQEEAQRAAERLLNARRQHEANLAEHRGRPRTPPAGRSVHASVPAAAGAALPVAWLGSRAVARMRRRARRRNNLCPACGYDLRATPGRCPECGTAAAGKVVAPAAGSG